jgi:hypothetical protein
LTDQQGEIKKLLIPLMQIKGCEFPSKIISLDLEQSRFYRTEPKLSRVFIEIDVNKRQLQSQSSEGWLYLSYINLCQKNYKQSLNYLKKVKATDQLSKRSLKIIRWIVDSHSVALDKSPNGAALRLQALSLLLKTKHRPDLSYNQKELIKEKDDKELRKRIEEDLLTYNDGINHVDSSLILTSNQELKLLQKFLPGISRIKSRIQFLLEGHYLKEEVTFGQLPINDPLLYSDNLRYYFKEIEEQKDHSPFSIMQPGNGLNLSFLKLYTMARSGTDLEKKYVQFILDNIQRKKNKHYDLVVYIQYALLVGKEAPALEEDMTDKLQKWLSNTYNTIWEYQKKQRIQSPNSNKIKENQAVDKKVSIEKEILFPLISSEKIEVTKEFEEPLKFDPKLENPVQKKVEELEKLSQKLAEDYFSKKEKKENEKKEFKIPEKAENRRYKNAINNSGKEFQEGYEIGRKENLNGTNFEFVKEKKIDELTETLKEEVEKLQKPLLKLEQKILSLANKESPIKEIALRERLLVEGGTKQPLRLGDLIRLFLKGETRAFKKANPYLTVNEIEQLYNEIGNFLLLKSEKQHFERALDLITKIEKNNEELLQESLIQKLAETLTSQRVYNPQEHIECLIFETQGNIRIRKRQFELIQEMIKTTDQGVYRNLAVQLIMGGGKTSVLASILGLLSARKKRLPLFIVPSPLYKTVKANLQKTQLENFGQEVAPIDLERKKFTAENLKWIEKELQKSITKEKMVLMKPEMIQSLCLEFIFLLDQHAGSESEKNKEELEVKIETLRSILNIFRDKTDALGDEIDQLLNTLKAVNFPGGDEVRVEQSRIDLVKEIYKIATDENELINVDGKTKQLSDLMGLKTNKQTLLSEENYTKYVMPAIAQSLLYYAPIASKLGENKELKKSCLRYLCNEISPKIQESYDKAEHDECLENDNYEKLTPEEIEDYKFLHFLRELYQFGKGNDQEAANLIGLSRHILNDTLAGTLSKNGNRHYGRKSKTNAKVVPYLGVGSPATTEFADHYRAICFHYQTAILEGISANQILELAKNANAAALHSAKKLKIPFNETKEAINFKKATGVDLHLIERAGNLEKAALYVNESNERILDLESYTIATEVTFHSKRLNSTPHMFFDQFGGESSFRGFTGTDWNKSTYPPGLEVRSDKGSNGRITDLTLERKVPVHQMDSDNPAEILMQIMKQHATPERIRGIIDAGGEFKKYENKQVAEKILEAQTELEAVVFFGRAEGQSTPDTLFMLKKGSKEPITLQSSHLEDILAKGVALEKIFFYYDERHTTGTDFVQLPNAINLITVGEKSFKRDFDQGAMRLRELFSKQEIEVIVNKDSASNFINGGKEIDDIILTTVEKEAVATAEQTVHSFFEQLDNVPKRHALKSLLDMNKSVKDISEIYRKENYRKIFITDVEDDPYRLFGQISKEIKTLEGIKERAEKLKERHKGNEAIILEIDQLVKRAEQSLFLTETMMSPISENFGQGEEIEICTELDKENQTDQTKEMQLEVELQQELDLYNQQKGKEGLREEKKWKNETIGATLSAFLDEFTYGNIYSSSDGLVSNSLQYLFESKLLEYKTDFSKIFDRFKILVTENFRLTYKEPVSVFNKAQKPANQILFVKGKNNVTRALFISYYEAYQFREYLTNLYKDNWEKKQKGGELMEGIDRIWLSGVEGDLFITNPFADLDKKDEDVKRILLQANFFNGYASYLDEHEEEALKWLKENYELKLRYLKLKVEKDEKQRKILYNSNLLGKN